MFSRHLASQWGSGMERLEKSLGARPAGDQRLTPLREAVRLGLPGGGEMVVRHRVERGIILAVAALDRGTLILPDTFLASGAVAPTPVGFAPSDLQPAFGLVGSDDDTKAVFRKADVVSALKKATAAGVVLRNIRSVAGFERRLNDITCAGCHQTRAIGGFHFPGVDWMAEKPDNSVTVPASPHFFGDQPRRRDILVAMRDGRMPDFSRGFADRPQVRGSREVAGTEYDDGWGATCYDRGGSAVPDKSFRSWTCASGLVCQVERKTAGSSHIGMCFVSGR